MAMSSKQESDTSIPLPEHHKAGWKSRLHRFQSSLRRSFRSKKVSRSTVDDRARRHEHAKDKEHYLLNRSSFTRDREDVRREYLSLENHGRVSTKRDNGTKTISHDNYMNGKTLSDGCSLDKRKFEPSKTISNNNFRAKENCVALLSNAHSSELAGLDRDTSNKKKRLQKVKLQRVNVNTQSTSISKSKSLSILTNLFRRSNHSKNNDNRGKRLSNATSKTTVSQTFISTAVRTDFDTLLTGDPTLSSSSIDSFPDSDHHLKRDDKYYSLKRSKGALIFPKNNLARALSLDTSLDPESRLMEKSRTLAAIPPCIRVEEFRDNCGFFERSLTVEFVHDSSGSVTIDAGTDYYHRLTTCSTPVISLQQSEVDLNSSGDRDKDDIKISSDTVPDITQETEKSNHHERKQAVYSSLSFFTDKTSSNGDIGSPGFLQGEMDIAAEKTHSQFAVETGKGQSESSDDRSSPRSEPKDFVDFKPDMGNNASYVQKSGKLLPTKATLIRPKRRHERYSNENCSDGEDEPIMIEDNFLECFEREFRDEQFNDSFPRSKKACSCNGLSKEKSRPLYVVDESVINNSQINYSTGESSDVKPEIGEIIKKHNREELDDDKNLVYDHMRHLSNSKVNNLPEASDEHFCSSTHGQTDRKEPLSVSDCLHSTETRQELTDSKLMECSPESFCPSLSKKANLGSDHVKDKLITDGFLEIHNTDQGFTEKGLQSPIVNSFPQSPFASSTPAQAMHSSYPDIATMHLSQPLDENNESSCNSHQLESSLEESSLEKKAQPSLSLDLSKCKSNGNIARSHLSPELTGERMRSCSTRIPFRSPLHQVLLTENRSASCTQLDKKDEENAICSSPPYVRPRIQSLEELPPCTAEVVLRKKRNVMKKTRLKHTASLPVVDHIFDELIDKEKRHSYGGLGDGLLLELPHLLQRSLSAEGQLDSCNSSVQSMNSSPLGSTMSVVSDLSVTGSFDKSLGRSRSVPGHLGIADIPQASPIPEEHSSVSETDLVSNFVEDSAGDNEDCDDDDNDGNICEMDAPEAFAEALWDHVTMDPEELSFQVGDIITVLAMTSCDWWFGQVKDRVGWFPAPFARVRVSQTLAADETKLAPPVRTRKGTNEGFLTDAVVRSRVVEEIVNTERDYVKNLRDVVEGYLKQARIRADMFTEEQIVTIFSNIEQIYHFHQEILKQLEACFVKEDPCGSEIGAVFLENKHGFEIYSEYCNNHPHAMAELKSLCESNKYKQFFEACRLLQQMISISLDGFLLTPVQKICKYPLQLAELKKHTKPNHRDFQAVKHALDTMKEVASLINERKRKVESIHKIAKWQSIIEGWEGEDVLDRSSELIHSGDVIKISNGISQDRVMFLFDHQLVLCKKDILKKNGLTYKGRIFVDDCTVREENSEKSTLHHTWKIYNRKKERWYIFYTKKADDKELWLSAFQEERRRVSEDARTGLIISQKTRKAAMRAAQTSTKQKKVNGKKDKLQKSHSTAEIKPSSPTLQLPKPVSSADLREEDEEERDSLDPRSSVTRRSFGLKGSKKSKEKRMSSVF